MKHIKIKKLIPSARKPVYASDGAGCFDIFTTEAGMVRPGRPKKFGTGLAIEVPEDYVLLIFSRSGHGFNSDVRLSNCTGLIDSDYRGELKVKLAQDPNIQFEGDQSYHVSEGERIAQGLIVAAEQVQFEWVDELSSTQRGEGGFQSTGK